MPLSIARLSASAPSSHDLSLAAFTINIAESNFRHTQAAVAAEGTSAINNADQIERGYERIDERLNALGAKITRVPERDSR